MNSYPKGVFDFESGGNKIEGKICTWSLNRFCHKNGDLTVNQLFDLLTTGISIRAIADILLCCVEYNYRGKDFPYSIDEAMDWIDDIGGISVASKLIEDSLSVKEDKPSKKKAKDR